MNVSFDLPANLLPALLILAVMAFGGSCKEPDSGKPVSIDLPEPVLKGPVSLEEALLERRSLREYSSEALKLADIGQLLWAAQGITDSGFYRTAPSAGALYPLEVFLIAGNISGLDPGVYRYQPKSHSLVMHMPDDVRKTLYKAALNQESIKSAPCVIVITGVMERTRSKYGSRAERYVYMEAGHAAQNLLLQSTALDLAGVVIGAFEDTATANALKLKKEVPLYLIPIGKR